MRAQVGGGMPQQLIHVGFVWAANSSEDTTTTEYVLFARREQAPLRASVLRLQEISTRHAVSGQSTCEPLDVPAEQHAIGFESEFQAQAAAVLADLFDDLIRNTAGDGQGVVA